MLDARTTGSKALAYSRLPIYGSRHVSSNQYKSAGKMTVSKQSETEIDYWLPSIRHHPTFHPWLHRGKYVFAESFWLTPARVLRGREWSMIADEAKLQTTPSRSGFDAVQRAPYMAASEYTWHHCFRRTKETTGDVAVASGSPCASENFRGAPERDTRRGVKQDQVPCDNSVDQRRTVKFQGRWSKHLPRWSD
jgi:hypothetical protein